MAYWPAGPTGLYPEAAAPLADFLVRLAQAGRRVARLYYGAEPGAWVAHGFTDAWASAPPSALTLALTLRTLTLTLTASAAPLGPNPSPNPTHPNPNPNRERRPPRP